METRPCCVNWPAVIFHGERFCVHHANVRLGTKPAEEFAALRIEL